MIFMSFFLQLSSNFLNSESRSVNFDFSDKMFSEIVVLIPGIKDNFDFERLNIDLKSGKELIKELILTFPSLSTFVKKYRYFKFSLSNFIF